MSISERQEEAAMEEVSEIKSMKEDGPTSGSRKRIKSMKEDGPTSGSRKRIKSMKEDGSTSGSPKRYPVSFLKFLNDYERRVEERKKKKADTATVTGIDKESVARIMEYMNNSSQYMECMNKNSHTDDDKKSLSDTFEAGNAKWDSMSISERAPYVLEKDMKYFEELWKEEEQQKKEHEELEEAHAYYANWDKNRNKR